MRMVTDPRMVKVLTLRSVEDGQSDNRAGQESRSHHASYLVRHVAPIRCYRFG